MEAVWIDRESSLSVAMFRNCDKLLRTRGKMKISGCRSLSTTDYYTQVRKPSVWLTQRG